MNFGGAAHEAHGHRHLNGAHQIAVGVLLPGCEGGVLSAAGGVGVGTGLDSAGVVAGGNDHGDDAVHDALVVGGRPVGICGGKGIGGDHFIDNLFPANGVLLEDGAGAGDSVVCQVGEDTQLGAAAGELLQEGCHGLGHSVHRVGAHGIPGVHQQVNHHHWAHQGVQHPDLHVLHAAAQLHQHGVPGVADLGDLLLVLQDLPLGVEGGRHVQQLDLGNHDTAGIVGSEAAARPGHLGCIGAGRHHGWLLRNHGDDVILAVDYEIDSHAHGERKAANYILNHVVGLVHVQGISLLQDGLLLRRQCTELGHLLHALLNREFEKSGIAAALHGCFCPFLLNKMCEGLCLFGHSQKSNLRANS